MRAYALLCSLLGVTLVNGATLVVGTGQPFTTIASAIAASRDGDTIDIQVTGTLSESLFVRNRTLTLMGRGTRNTVVAGSHTFDSCSIVMYGLKFVGRTGTPGSGGHGGYSPSSPDPCGWTQACACDSPAFAGGPGGDCITLNSSHVLVDSSTVDGGRGGCGQGISCGYQYPASGGYPPVPYCVNNPVTCGGCGPKGLAMLLLNGSSVQCQRITTGNVYASGVVDTVSKDAGSSISGCIQADVVPALNVPRQRVPPPSDVRVLASGLRLLLGNTGVPRRPVAFSLLDARGRALRHATTSPTADSDLIVDVADLPPGVYLVRVGADTWRWCGTVVVGR